MIEQFGLFESKTKRRSAPSELWENGILEGKIASFTIQIILEMDLNLKRNIYICAITYLRKGDLSMTNMTLSLPTELHKKMKQFSEVRWSEVARKAIQKRVEDLETLERIASKSKLTEKDAKEIASRINKAAAKKFLA